MAFSPITYFKESLEELHQVRWPTRQQAIRLSVIVLVFTIMLMEIMGVLIIRRITNIDI